MPSLGQVLELCGNFSEFDRHCEEFRVAAKIPQANVRNLDFTVFNRQAAKLIYRREWEDFPCDVLDLRSYRKAVETRPMK